LNAHSFDRHQSSFPIMGHGYPELGEDEKPTAEEDVVYSDQREEDPDLRILHYNDIYHPEYELQLNPDQMLIVDQCTITRAGWRGRPFPNDRQLLS
jgi:hypothetical protein